MFTEGLDTKSVKWVRNETLKDVVNLPRDRNIPISIPTQKPWPGNGGRGLPSAAKFRSGHLPTGAAAIAVTRVGGDESGSDMDDSVDTEDEVYGGRYSVESSSSPQHDDRSRRQRYSNVSKALPPRKQSYVISHNGCSDFSSSRVGGVGRSDYSDDESLDSLVSSECGSTGEGSNASSAPKRGNYVSESYSSSVPSHSHTDISADKEFIERRTANKQTFNNGVPSAPPLNISSKDTHKDAEPSPTSRSHVTSSAADAKVSSTAKEEDILRNTVSDVGAQGNNGNGISEKSPRPSIIAESAVSFPARLPTFRAIGQGPWCAVISYDACVRLCLHSWARGCMEAPMFLENECALLRSAFGLQQILLQSEEELLEKRSSQIISGEAARKPKISIGKMKVQVRKIKMVFDPPSGCSSLSLKLPIVKVGSVQYRFSDLLSTLCSRFKALRNAHMVPQIPVKGSVYPRESTQYIKQISGLLKGSVKTLRSSSSSYDMVQVQETYSCLIRLKSSPEGDAVRMQPGSGETHVFFPDGPGDDLIIEVQDSKGKYYGRVLAQLASITDDSCDKLRWWSIYQEPEHEFIGKIQLQINYSTCTDENGHLKCGSVAETLAYDFALEVAMKLQHFRQRSLLLDGPWKWLLTEFASYYGISDVYTKLRYLSYVMDVATPTEDCLLLIYDLLSPVIMKGNNRSTLSHQENRILGEIQEQIEKLLGLVFENYKYLDESLLSGMMDVYRPSSGSPAPALAPAIKLYTLLHDILAPEVQIKLCSYFQAATKNRSRRHLGETDELLANNSEGSLLDAVMLSTAYQKMKSLCLNIRNEIFTDIQIHNHHVLPSFIDLPNISASIYSVELCSRLRAFLVACPPMGPLPPVVDLVIATADLQRDLSGWNINPVKGGLDARELFHLYIIVWIQDKRLTLLESCKLDKVKWSGVRTQHSTTPFADEIYDRLKETLNEYEAIIHRWPEYTLVLEKAIADVEKAIMEALEKQYADVLSPLKDSLAPKKFGLKYIQKLAKNNTTAYIVPEELGVLLNSMKRVIDVLRPRLESQLKSWGSCIPNGGSAAPGECLGEVAVMLRTKYRNYMQAVVDKLAENTRMQSATKMKKIIQDSKETAVESDVRSRMQLLREQLTDTIGHLHAVFGTHVFVAICRGYWDRMGQDVLTFLEDKKDNKLKYKGAISSKNFG
ncbi:hypothetical protein Sjap_017154 [Stephania japonica]|uniref:Pesticidal crystal cry8Ba protein n=1 Tax=Stephania japonica TaxID=461633 RepID=A0AAP0I5L7_9MAGN